MTMRAERRRSFGWVVLAAVMMWVAILLAFVGYANAQTGGFVFSERESGQPHGLYVRGWNTTGTAIQAGTLVQADTTATGSVPQIAMGKGFKTWTGSVLDFHKIIGVLIDPAPAGFGWARIMVKGFTNNVKVMSGMTGGSYWRPSLTAPGRLTTWAASDSERVYVATPCGVFQRYAATDTSVGYGWVDFPVR